MTRGQNRALNQVVLSDSQYRNIAEIVKKWTGIHLRINKKPMIASRLSKRMRATDTYSIVEYLRYLAADPTGIERHRFISAFTTNLTRFNREPQHFHHFSMAVLPELVARARAGDAIRIWSAGCSSGEEPYQIAFHALQNCNEIGTHDFRILATDIDVEMIAQCKRGRYARKNAEALPSGQIDSFFEADSNDPNDLVVCDNAKQLITFLHLDLHAIWPMKRPFDVIFCRNVAIYFDTDMQRKLWKRFTNSLKDKGILYTGHSEKIPDLKNCKLRYLHSGSYQMRKRQCT